MWSITRLFTRCIMRGQKFLPPRRSPARRLLNRCKWWPWPRDAVPMWQHIKANIIYFCGSVILWPAVSSFSGWRQLRKRWALMLRRHNPKTDKICVVDRRHTQWNAGLWSIYGCGSPDWSMYLIMYNNIRIYGEDVYHQCNNKGIIFMCTHTHMYPLYGLYRNVCVQLFAWNQNKQNCSISSEFGPLTKGLEHWEADFERKSTFFWNKLSDLISGTYNIILSHMI